ncbi:DUF421 domain-containing protein [Muricoccus radiodurans]|uniref:DUF421 domain-containing protein n=1 Tax=Muricoccus radiodurans TaxID=2231721 RepID=UPI003CEE5776
MVHAIKSGGELAVFFDSWFGLLRVAVVGTLAYAALVLLLRVTGKRTLTKMSAFDLIVTVALGSTLATVLLTKDVVLAEGVLAFALLALLQYAITWTSVRSAAVRRLVKAEPRLLLHRGAFLEGAMRAERVTEEEVRAAIRGEGIGDISVISAVVLETDGSLSVIPQEQAGQWSTLTDVSGAVADSAAGPKA